MKTPIFRIKIMNACLAKHVAICILVALLTLIHVPLSMALTPVEVAKLLASDGGVNDWFGASISVDGDTALIGADNVTGIGSA